MLTTPAVAEVRNEVDGSQTPRPGKQSNCELSATGRRADLYSAFAFREIQWDLRFSKQEDRFSATGRRGRFAENPAKRDGFYALTSYFSDNNDLIEDSGGFEPPIQLLTV